MFSPVESEQGFNFKPELPTSSAYYRLLKKLRRQVGHAIRDFKMIEEGDKVMVCISGGKDSYTLLDILLQFKRIARLILMWLRSTLTKNNRVSLKTYCHVI
jgi:Predicted ATPase of the PP-loop superfamily implicated in cell cycle control